MRRMGRLAVFFSVSQALICYECDNARNMEECINQKRARECNENENTCQQEIRTWGIGGMYKSITQRCKQKHACVNNHIQNPRAAWKETQCQPLRHPENSVCRCCCNWNYCNGAEYAGCWGYKKALEYYQEFNATTTTTVASVATRPKTTPSYKEWTTSDERIVTEIPDGPTPAGPSPMGPTMEGVTDAPPTISIALPELPKCTWTEWGEWDKCTETCGGGQRNRYRTPIGGTIGSPGCEGFDIATEYCATQDCTAKQCKDNYVDVCFLLPVSDSTNTADLRAMKKFIRDCQKHIGDFGSEDLQFCVYQYNTDVQRVLSLADSSVMQPRDLKETLDTMVPLSGVGSDLSNAMSAIVDDGFAESNGWRRNDQIPSVLVVLTDTLRDDSHYQSLVQVHNKAYRVVGVGIGEEADDRFMASIVSQPAEENAFSVSSYEKLNDIVDEIGYDICQVDSWRDDECMFENGGCASDETCFVQYNGRQCYPQSFF